MFWTHLRRWRNEQDHPRCCFRSFEFKQIFFINLRRYENNIHDRLSNVHHVIQRSATSILFGKTLRSLRKIRAMSNKNWMTDVFISLVRASSHLAISSSARMRFERGTNMYHPKSASWKQSAKTAAQRARFASVREVLRFRKFLTEPGDLNFGFALSLANVDERSLSSVSESQSLLGALHSTPLPPHATLFQLFRFSDVWPLKSSVTSQTDWWAHWIAFACRP